MGRQSTRHRYRTRREKNQSVWRAVRIISGMLLVLFIFLLIKNWREWWNYWKFYFY
ncbi:hypothetical protein [Lewinella sp. IMCC34183]|uniref:hypothetical protein n=1 Tax=Lewinella sp. IMCC34183 TaxID=2248762 RepID=UPI001300978A|nr:hypothetical protein [Lewinella sp. IMCC34183]